MISSIFYRRATVVLCIFCSVILSSPTNAQDTLDFKIEPPVIDLSFPKAPTIDLDEEDSLNEESIDKEVIGAENIVDSSENNKENESKTETEDNLEKNTSELSEKPILEKPASQKKKKKTPAPPPGFENLSEPQTTVVDIYFGDEYLISQLATYTPNDITFSNSLVILEKIPSVLDKNLIQNILDNPLPTHVEMACFYEGQENCGYLTPEIAGVIFHEDAFRVDLFINNEYLSVKSTGLRKYIPASDSEWSLLQNLSAAYAGTSSSRSSDQNVANNVNGNLNSNLNSNSDNDSNNTNYSINSHSTLAYKENRFQLLTNLRKTSDGNSENTIDEAVFRRDWQGLEYQVGYFRGNSSQFQFMGDKLIRGLRFASSLDTREDLRQTSGNELQVFLTSRSEVLIFKEDRLISSRFYDAGNQILDTRQLPGGAYDVTIKIINAAGIETEETRFYIKSNQLPPIDQPLYFIEAGEILNPEGSSGFADSTGRKLIRGGYHYRFSDQIGAMAGISHSSGDYPNSNESLSFSELEAGLTHLGKYHDFSVGGFAGNENRHGVRMNLRTRFSGLFFNASYRRVWNDNFDPASPVFENDLLNAPTTQAAVGFTSLLPFGRVELNGRINRRFDNTIETYSARFDLPRLRMGFTELYSGIQASREEGTSTLLLSFEVRFNKQHYTAQLRPEYAKTSSDTQESQSDIHSYGVVSWHDRDILEDKDLRIDLRGQNIDGQSGIGSEVDFSTQSGRIRLQAEKFSFSGENGSSSSKGTRINGNGFTSFMVNGSSMKLGGKDQSQSALLVKINGDISDATFDILIDDSRRGVAFPNKTTAINLRPFSTYQVRLAQRGSAFVEYEETEKTVTLYPGNVVTLEWDAAELNVVFGKLVDETGAPIQNALISGVSGIATTDEFGLFQAEIKSNVESISVETTDSRCEITLPEYTVKKRIGNLGKLSCELTRK